MIRGFFLAMILVVLGYALSFVLFVSTLPRTPDDMPRADGIVVLTGGDARLDAAADLLEHGAAKRMLVSGVSQTTTRDTLKKVMHGGAWFDCCVDIGYAAEDTHGNAVEAADWTRQHGFKSMVLVTGRYHMPRSLREFHADAGHRLDALSGGRKRHRSVRLVAASRHHPATATRICKISRQPGDDGYHMIGIT